MRILKFIAPAAVALSLTPATFANAFAGSNPTGIWLDNDGRGAVEIKPCGDALCGNVVWVKSSADAEGCGKQIIGGVKSVGGGRWDNGWIYSPEKGRKYDVELVPLSSGNLKVVGYAGLKFLSKTMIWKPAPADLQLCNQTNTAAPGTTNAAAPAATIAPNTNDVKTNAPAPAVEANAAPTTTTPATSPSTVSPPPAKATADAKTPATSSDPKKSKPEEVARASETPPTEDNSGPTGDLGKMKIGDTQLDKVFSHKDGKCKLDLPWIKVTIDCEQ